MNDIKQDYSMKLGEGGEAFFIFETLENIPKSLQTSPIVSPAGSPPGVPTEGTTSATTLQEPEFLDINIPGIHGAASPQLSKVRPKISENQRANTVVGMKSMPPQSFRLAYQIKENFHMRPRQNLRGGDQ